MQRTDNTGKAKSAHRQLASSTTLSRRYTKRPSIDVDKISMSDIKRSPKIKRFNQSRVPVTHVMISEPDAESLTMTQEAEEMLGQESPIITEEDIRLFRQMESEAMMAESEGVAEEDQATMEETGSMMEENQVMIGGDEAMMEDNGSMMERDEALMEEESSVAEEEMRTMPRMGDDSMFTEQFATRKQPMMEERSVMMEQPTIRTRATAWSQPVARESVQPMMGEQLMTAETEQPVAQRTVHPLQKVANTRMRARKSTPKNTKRPSSVELKSREIQKALASASAVNEYTHTKKKNKKLSALNVGLGRVLLAFACATVAVFAIVYFVNLNMPDISLKVAAMQTGINASYPSYIPRDYSISTITSEDKKITLAIKNEQEGTQFTLSEETSSWDSNALLTNYVKDVYGDNYTVVKEQGLTMYLSGSNATWVNGGIVYKLTTSNDTLTNKQIRAIAVSL